MSTNKNFLVSDIFTPTRGKAMYTRDYAERNAGIYPVFSASLSAPLCHIDTYDYEGAFLTWTTNGYGGRVQIITGKFSINGDRGILVPKNSILPDLDYIRHVLEPVLVSQAVGRIVDGKKNEYTKVSPEITASSVLTLPVIDGEFNLTKMAAIGAKLRRIDALQNQILSCQESILSSEAVIDCAEPFVTILLGDERYFSLSIGERVLKKNGVAVGIPVYSANVNKPFTYTEQSNLSDFKNGSLIWGIDGIFDWNLIPSDTEFSTTDHCGRVQIKSKDLDPEYVFYCLKATRLEYGFDRVFRANLDNMKALVEIKIPLNKKMQFSISRQKEFAKRYRELNALKKNTCRILESLCNMQVNLEI